MEDGSSDDGKNGGASSSSSSSGGHWDRMEEQAMRALDEKLDSAAAADGHRNSLSASASGAMARRPHESAAVPQDSKRMMGEQNEGDDCGSGHRQLTQSSSAQPASRWQHLEDAGRQLEEVCKSEPYRPEDHALTAEEMWGDTSDEEDGTRKERTDGAGRAVASTSARQPDGQPLEDAMLTAEEMWGGLSDDEGGAADKTTTKDPTAVSAVVPTQPSAHGGGIPLKQSEPLAPPQPLPTPSGGGTSLSDAERLKRVLAGADAAQVLGKLRFAELTAVAADCQKAVETLRWVLTRQHEMASAAGL